MKERNFGIDLYRILCMFAIVTAHLATVGGLSIAAWANLSADYVICFVQECCQIGVAGFTLISGFVGCSQKPRLKGVMNIWLQTAFWAIAFGIIFRAIDSSYVPGRNFFEYAFPFAAGTYWYVTAYVLMYFFTPFLNAGIKSIDKKTAGIFILILAVLIYVLPSFLNNDIYQTGNGRSAIGLLYMYLVGGYIGTYFEDIKLNSWIYFLIFVAACAFGVISYMRFAHPMYLTSPYVLVASVALLIILGRQSKMGAFDSLIKFIAPGTFAVYLIHDNPLVMTYWLPGVTERLAQYNIFVMSLYLFGFALAVFFACIIIDLIRRGLFKLLKVNLLLTKLDNFIFKAS